MTRSDATSPSAPVEGDADGTEADGSARVRPTRRRRRVVGFVLLLLCVVLAVVAGAAVSLRSDALHARSELKAAALQVPHFQAQVVAGDHVAAEVTLASLQKHAAVGRADTHGPLWSVARAAPWVGADVRAAQTVSDVVDQLAGHALPALADASWLLDPATFAPVGGHLNMAPLVAVAPKVVAADVVVQSAVRRLAAIDSGALHPALAAPLTDLRTQIDKVSRTTAKASRTVRLLTAMLGVDGPRQYLLLVQNGAEQRALGGMVGEVVLLRVADGAATIVDQRSGESLGDLAAPALPLTAEEQTLFSEGLGDDMRNVTATPDFPRSAQLARAIWNNQVGVEVDGVVSVDTGTLSLVLGATGPVTLATGQQLTAGNVVRTLLNSVYFDIPDPVAQDAFFAAAAKSVFDAVAGGQGKATDTVHALAQAAREGRLMVWSAHQDEQALLSGTDLGGALVGVQGRSPVIGVYLNDASSAKIGYYLRTDVAATSTAQRPDGSQTVAVTVTLTSTAPWNAAGFPARLRGAGMEVHPGEVRDHVLVYAPAGGRVQIVRVTGGDLGGFEQTHDGLAVVDRTVLLKPGQRSVITYEVLTGKDQPGKPVLRVTPPNLG